MDDTSKLWHAHMGHVNYQWLAMMFNEKMVMGLSKIMQPKEVCTDCLMSKQARKHVPSRSTFSAKRVLELVHADLCGLITPETAG